MIAKRTELNLTTDLVWDLLLNRRQNQNCRLFFWAAQSGKDIIHGISEFIDLIYS